MKLANVLGALFLVLVVVSSFLIWAKAPCGLWTYAKAGDIPNRCADYRR
ncbi:hypothetical protein OG393_29360 [Streptomyces sp. NBC_01216]|nr:hypothetical protein OG393_29360 [Streptomyces sp. NBC_01216]